MSMINQKVFENHLEKLLEESHPIPHKRVLEQLLEKVERVNFYQLTQKKPGEAKISRAEHVVICIQEILKIAQENYWGLCKKHDFIYLYNGAFWKLLDIDELKTFLGEAAKCMGINGYQAKYHRFKDELFKQFMSSAILPSPPTSEKTVLINLQNGTFEINSKGTILSDFSRNNFLKYQLPFEYNPNAKAPLFEKFINAVLPDYESRRVLAEYIGYIFIHNNALKLEKALLLYGTGANGKSVFFEIIKALIGVENFASYSLQSLTNANGYYRASLANKLVNYGSEINGKLESSIFKQLVSGEPVEARFPYGNPFILYDYAKLIFNCNELPREVEHTNAFFRRFLIIPFNVTIPENDQDKELATKIIHNELSGVFNWVLKGLERVLKNKKFSSCAAADKLLHQYRKESDSVAMFLEENQYIPHVVNYKLTKELYCEYRSYCIHDGYKPTGHSKFNKRLKAQGIIIERKSQGNVAFITNSGSAL